MKEEIVVFFNFEHRVLGRYFAMYYVIMTKYLSNTLCPKLKTLHFFYLLNVCIVSFRILSSYSRLYTPKI